MAKNELPLVSIVTPVYNASRFLQDTIDTSKNQTYENWEHIFVDDASSDNSVTIIKRAQKKDKRIKLVQFKANGGAAKARNAGTKAATGKYLAFLDADDLWWTHKIQVQVDFAEENNYDFVFSGYQFAKSSGVPMGGPVVVPESINYVQALKNPIIWTSTVLLNLDNIPRELIMMPDVRRGQDAATWWQILRETGMTAHSLQESLAFYRRSNGSLSSNKFKAIGRTWYLYREVEKLGLLKSLYCFPFYAYNAVRKRV